MYTFVLVGKHGKLKSHRRFCNVGLEISPPQRTNVPATEYGATHFCNAQLESSDQVNLMEYIENEC